MTNKEYGIIGQVAPLADTDTELFLVPANTQLVASTVAFCNQGSDNARYRIAVVKAGETLSQKHYIRFNKFLEGNDDDRMTIGVTLGAGDKIIVRSDTANLSFSLFGCKLTPNS